MLHQTIQTAFLYLAVLTFPTSVIAEYRDHGRFLGPLFSYADYQLSQASYADRVGLDSSVSETEKGYILFGGYRINRHVGIELGWHSIAEVNGTSETNNTAKGVDITASLKSYQLSLVGALPISDRLELIGSLGQHSYRLSTKSNLNLENTTRRLTGNDLTTALGFKYNIAPLLSLRYLNQNLALDADEIKLHSLGIQLGY